MQTQSSKGVDTSNQLVQSWEHVRLVPRFSESLGTRLGNMYADKGIDLHLKISQL